MSGEYFELCRKLPCGCHIKQRAVLAPDHPGMSDEDLDRHVRMLKYWSQDRAARHKCELVSAENPCGVAPKAKP